LVLPWKVLKFTESSGLRLLSSRADAMIYVLLESHPKGMSINIEYYRNAILLNFLSPAFTGIPIYGLHIIDLRKSGKVFSDHRPLPTNR
jgi:hypothetical protein